MEGALLTVDFWDVGQADCTTIRLPNGRYVVIDVGRRGSPLVDWFNSRPGLNAQIEAIVLTHNDGDHAGALAGIVKTKGASVRAIWMLVDDDIRSGRFQRIWRAALEWENQTGFEIKRAEKGKEIWADESSNTRLVVVHPTFSANVEATSHNDASAVLLLQSDGKDLIAWPGDLEIRKAGKILAPFEAQIVVGPHHGGPSDYPSKAVRKNLTEFERMRRREEVKDAVGSLSPQRSWISVGTENGYHHPRPGYLDLLARSGARVVCSQLTLCCDRRYVLNKVPVMRGSALLGLPASRSGTPCRGSMRFYLKDGELVPDRWDAEHAKKVSALLRPRCLSAS